MLRLQKLLQKLLLLVAAVDGLGAAEGAVVVVLVLVVSFVFDHVFFPVVLVSHL